MVYSNVKKVFGPYIRKDGRQHVVILFTDGKKKTVSYPKFLMENKIGRVLNLNETVDHVDGDFTNNREDNLQILDRSEHVTLDKKRIGEADFECEYCGIVFTLKGRRLHEAYHSRKLGKKGPFCGRRCAGKASHSIDQFQSKPVSKSYFTNKSLTRET